MKEEAMGRKGLKVRGPLGTAVLILSLIAVAYCSGAARGAEASCGGALGSGSWVSGNIAPGQSCEYTFYGRAGDTVSIALTSGDFDAWLDLKDPSGRIVISNNDGYGGSNSLIDRYTLASTGTYTILARSYKVKAGGSFRIYLKQANGFIVNQLSRRCIDVIGTPATTSGARLQLWDCDFQLQPNQTDQRWEFTPEGFIRNRLSGKCIDVQGSPGQRNGLLLQLWDCEYQVQAGKSDQRWEMTKDGYIRNRLSGKCIDVMGTPGTTNAAALQLWDCESTGSQTDQRWTIE
jgi:hypothetical protein